MYVIKQTNPHFQEFQTRNSGSSWVCSWTPQLGKIANHPSCHLQLSILWKKSEIKYTYKKCVTLLNILRNEGSKRNRCFFLKIPTPQNYVILNHCIPKLPGNEMFVKWHSVQLSLFQGQKRIQVSHSLNWTGMAPFLSGACTLADYLPFTTH